MNECLQQYDVKQTIYSTSDDPVTVNLGNKLADDLAEVAKWIEPKYEEDQYKEKE